jgi:hypothetical protein
MYALDHIVHFISCPPAEAATKLREMGFHAVEGGIHQTWGTYNSLCYFGLTYLEFLAIENWEVAKQSDNPLIKQIVREAERGEGLCQIAFRANDIERTASQLKEKGIKTIGPFPGRRTREDGSVIEWRMLFAENQAVRHPLPFFIEWKQHDIERMKDLTTRAIISKHKNGIQKIDYIAYAVHSVDETIDNWKNWFELEAGERYTDERLQANCQLMLLEEANILFCEPYGPGAVADILELRGEYPFLLKFKGEDQNKEHSLFGSLYNI